MQQVELPSTSSVADFTQDAAAAVAGPDDRERDARKRLKAVETLGHQAACPGNPSRLLDDAAALLAEALDMPCAVSAEWIQETRTLQQRARECGGLSPADPEDCGESVGEPNASLAAFSLGSRRVVVIDELARESRFAEPVLRRLGIATAVAVPLRLGESLFGVLIAGDRQHHPLSGDERSFAETIGHLVAVTLGRWQTEQLLEEERRLAHSMLETLDSLVLIVDSDWQILEANPACRRIAGYEPEELLGRPMCSMFDDPEQGGLLQTLLEDFDSQTVPFGSEGVLKTKQGRRRNIVWSIRKLAVALPAKARFIVTGVDITEQRAAEDRAARAEAAAAAVADRTAEKAPVADADTAKPASTASGQESPFGVMPSPINIERRTKPRRSYPYAQRIAPVINGTRPDLRDFVEIQCNDIAAGGFSFVSDAPPVSDAYVVALGCAPKVTYLSAQIAHVTRVQHDGKRRFLIGCNYMGRVVY